MTDWTSVGLWGGIKTAEPVGTVDPRIVDAFEHDNGFPLLPHLLVVGLVGSHSHGTYVPSAHPAGIDDLDLMGIVVPPVNYHLGLPRWEHWTLRQDELDVVFYSLDKAVRLLCKCNPNIVGLLWLEDAHYVYRHPLFFRLRTRRDLFSSRKAIPAFTGYAYDQLKRMEAFDVDRFADYEVLSAACAPVDPVLQADANKLHHIAQERGIPLETLQAFRKLHKQFFSGYMGEKRKALVREFSYDVKNAAHLIRLLRMGIEFLETGVLRVLRPDAEELISIKQGKWTLEQVKDEAERLFARFKGIDSPLPEDIDLDAVNQLLVDTHRIMLRL